MADLSTEQLDQKRARNREYMRAYRATPEGRAATKLSKQKFYATPEGREVRREGHRRWQKSVKGKASVARYQAKTYKAHPRPKMTEDERKARAKESNARSLSRPDVKARRRLTAWRLHIKVTYGLSAEEYDAMAINGCQICGAPDRPEKRLHVDHCHTSGIVRGVLCDPCNRGIGCFGDSPAKLVKAASYLKGH